MISNEYVKTMAAYNAWQNTVLLAAATRLDDDARRADTGAFFGSIHATANHLLWGDQIWMSRFSDVEAPKGGIEGSPCLIANWDDLLSARGTLDQVISVWASTVDGEWLAQEMSWFSGAAQRQISKPAWFLVTHFFNHQTHHRGQIHAMVTAAGATTDDTDLFYLPDALNPLQAR